MTENILINNSEKEKNKKKKYKKNNRLILTLTILLSVSIISTSLAVYFHFQHKSKENELEVLSQQMEQLQKESLSLKEQIPQEDYLLNSQLKDLANQYNLPMVFMQSIFKDEIVYPGEKGLTFLPIDYSLSKTNIDWKCLLIEENENTYYDKSTGIKGIKGIDVSTFQGNNINWKHVKEDGVEFAMLRAGYRGYDSGKMVKDNTFDINLAGALKANIDVGAYFFSQSISTKEAVEEAEMMIEMINGKNLQYPIVFDMEEISHDEHRTENLTQKERTDIALAFCKRIKEAGYTPMIYGNIAWLVERYDISRILEYDIWFAQYLNTPFFPYKMQMWQYTGKGEVNGIKGNVDLNISFKDYSKK